MQRKKWLTAKQAWQLARQLADLDHIGNIEKVGQLINTHPSVIYRWRKDTIGLPDVRHTILLKELAVKEGIIKV